MTLLAPGFASGVADCLLQSQLQWTWMLCLFLGQSLIEIGESYKQLAEAKYTLEDTVKQNFLEPLHHLKSKDLHEVQVRICNTINIIRFAVLIFSWKQVKINDVEARKRTA